VMVWCAAVTLIVLRRRVLQLEALKSAHTKGWVYVDMKPDNLMIGQGPAKETVYLLDWGCALRTKDSQGNFQEDNTGGNDLFRSIRSQEGQGESTRWAVGRCLSTCGLAVVVVYSAGVAESADISHMGMLLLIAEECSRRCCRCGCCSCCCCCCCCSRLIDRSRA
jgi:hypothetical protein